MKRAKRRGVTIVEMLVVLVILGGILTLAVPERLAEPHVDFVRDTQVSAQRDRRSATHSYLDGTLRVRVTAWPSGFTIVDTVASGGAKRDPYAR